MQLALGSETKTVHARELAPATKMSKKIVAARDLLAGHVLGEGDLALKSPGDGMPPYELDAVLGSVLRVGLREDEALSPAVLEAPAPAKEPSGAFAGGTGNDA